MLSLITTTDWVRITLLYSHLVLCAFAITIVLRTDIGIVLGNFTRQELKSTANTVTLLLVALWATGLSIIYIDTGFNPDVLITKSKLLLKLMCAITLTLNGMVLHHYSFPVFSKNPNLVTTKESILLVVTGALSTSHWMLAAFVGMSKPLGRLPFHVLLSAYGIFTLGVTVTSLFFTPVLANVLSKQESQSA